MWRTWTIGILGLWLIVLPLLFRVGMTQDVVVAFSGLLIVGLAFWKLASERTCDEISSVPSDNRPLQE